MKATIISAPTNDNPPRMPVEGMHIAEVFDALGWEVFFLDIGVLGYALEAVRLEVTKEDPNIIIFTCNRNQYRYVKQYVTLIAKSLPTKLLVACTDLDPKDLRNWLPDLDFAIRGPPGDSLRKISGRTQTRNFEDIPSNGEEPVTLPEYHPLTCNFEQYAKLRNVRSADIPIQLFGQKIDANDVVRTVLRLRLKYAVQVFNLLGDVTDTSWLLEIFRKLEEEDLVGAPANLAWTCTMPNPMDLTTGVIRELADHDVKVLTFDWKTDRKDQMEHVIETSIRAGIMPTIRLTFGDQQTFWDYTKMAEFLKTHEGVISSPRFFTDESRLNDEGYVASLSNGVYLPKNINLYGDMETLAATMMVLNKDVERLEAFAKQK